MAENEDYAGDANTKDTNDTNDNNDNNETAVDVESPPDTGNATQVDSKGGYSSRQCSLLCVLLLIAGTD